MAKPQQPELRRSERIPAIDPDASEAVLSAQSTPATTDPAAPVPEEQRPGHDPAHDEDKPVMDAMAERLGVVPEGEEPDDAPSVAEFDREQNEPAVVTTIRKRRRVLALAIGLTAAGAVIARQVLRRRR